MAKYALCIGINDYPGTGSDLSGCVNDANDWAAVLETRGFVTFKMFNKQATGKNIRAAMESTIANGKNGDLVVIQYSGHGSYVPDEDGDEADGADECICPYDVHSKGPITDDELFEIYSAKKQGVKLFVISDSCHSGTVARFAPITTPPTVVGRKPPQRKVKFLPPAAFLSRGNVAKLGIRRGIRPSKPPGCYAALLMAGCQDVEYSYDGYFRGRPNGVFSYVAMRALAHLPRSATYATWYKAVRKSLPSQQYPQTPNLFGSKHMKGWKVLS